jgi:hypothetical protein
MPLLFDWHVLKSEHFTVIYTSPVAWQARQTLQYAEVHKNHIDELLGNDSPPIPFVVEDVGMYANGIADPFMRHIHIYPHTPGPTYSLECTENWIRTVTVHEYTHGAHLTCAHGVAGVFQNIFGSLFSPNMYSPGWLIEGMGVYAESQISPYEGRLNEGFYDHYIQTLYAKNAFPTLVDITNQPLRFPRDTYYLYGGEFFDHLAQHYGNKRFARFVNAYSTYFWAPLGVIFPFMGIDAASRHVYGHSFPRLYAEWRNAEFEREKSMPDNACRKTFDGWYIHSLTSDDRSIYYLRSHSSKVDAFSIVARYEILQYDPAASTQKVVRTLPSSSNTPLRVHDNKLYYTCREIVDHKANRTFNGSGYTHTLNTINLATHTHTIILKDRIRAFCVISQDSILVSIDRKDTYGSSICLVTPATTQCICSTTLLIEDILLTDTDYVVIGKPEFSNSDIYIFNIDSVSFSLILSSPWTEAYLQYVKGSKVGFTSNHDGVHALYELDMETFDVIKLSDNRYARCGTVLEHYPDTIFFVGLTADGFDIFSAPVQREDCDFSWTPTHIPTVNALPDIETTPGTYLDILSTLVPKVRVPIALPSNRDLRTWLYGGLIIGQDAVRENTYYVFGAYDSRNDGPYIRLQWQCRMAAPLITDIYFSNDEFRYNATLPVYTRLHYGLNRATVFLSGYSFDNFARKELAPGIAWQLKYPHTILRFALVLPYERIAWRSSVNRYGQYAYVSGEHLFKHSRLICALNAFSDPDNPDSLQISPRGCDPLHAIQGMVIRIEYAHKLLPVRWGLWNPNIYIEDLFAAVFFDYGRANEGNEAFSIGIEIRPEIKAGFGYLQFSPRVGCAYTDDREISWYLQLISYTDAPYLAFPGR